MIVFGVAEVFGAATSGKLIGIYGKKFGLHLLFATGVLSCFTILSLRVADVPFGWTYYLASFLWGLADSCLNTSIIGLLVNMQFA